MSGLVIAAIVVLMGLSPSPTAVPTADGAVHLQSNIEQSLPGLFGAAHRPELGSLVCFDLSDHNIEDSNAV